MSTSTGPKRTLHQIIHDREEIGRLYLRGMTQMEIAGELAKNRTYTLDRSTIARDIKAVQEDWLRRSVQSMDTRKARELELLDQIEREAWLAWERSKAAKTRRKATTRDNLAAGGEGEATRVQAIGERWEEEQTGDPRYLAIMLDCSEKRCAITGVKAPVKLHHQGNLNDRINWDALSKEQLNRIAAGEPIEKVIPGISNN